MDDLNMANIEPAAAIPGEAASGEPPPSAAQPPLADAPRETVPSVTPETEIPSEQQPIQQSMEARQPAAADVTAEPIVAEPAAKSSEKPPKEKPQGKAEAKKEEPEPEPETKSDKMDWYILKVQSNREESIREGLLRRVAITGLGHYFGEVIVPTEKVTEFKGGKKKVIKRKLYPGYLVVHMEINDDTWFLVRETPGIGDFTGAAGRPSPMLPHEVARIVAKQEEKSEKAPKLKIAFREGERVKIKEGTFENFEGEVESIDETNGRVTVMINIFGRSTPVELEYWQIEAL
jgi:transcription termination/antitermination protein NusG